MHSPDLKPLVSFPRFQHGFPVLTETSLHLGLLGQQYHRHICSSCLRFQPWYEEKYLAYLWFFQELGGSKVSSIQCFRSNGDSIHRTRISRNGLLKCSFISSIGWVSMPDGLRLALQWFWKLAQRGSRRHQTPNITWIPCFAAAGKICSAVSHSLDEYVRTMWVLRTAKSASQSAVTLQAPPKWS